MKSVVDKGKTLLVDGPASVSLVSGKANVLGATIQINEKVVVRQGKRLPLWVTKKASFDVLLGEGAAINEFEEGTVPSSWEDAAKQLLCLDKPVTVLVLGDKDSGKTSFCTFLANEAVLNKLKTAVIDADLGQSDVGPPSTVGYTFVGEPVKDLFDIEAKDAVFVGSTSANRAMGRVVDGVVQLKKEALEADMDFIVVNTDGWVEGKEAIEYKKRLVSKVGAGAVVGLQRENELSPVLDVLDGVNVFVAESPRLIQPRSRENRKLLRELGYKKYLKEAKTRSLTFSWLKIEDALLGVGAPLHHKRLATLMNLLRTGFIYSEETADAILVVLSKNRSVTEEQIENAEEVLGKRVKVVRDGDEEGLLVALKDESDKFLGIGILHDVDYKRSLLKLYTPVSEQVHGLCFGQIKLDKNCKEVGLSTVYSSSL